MSIPQIRNMLLNNITQAITNQTSMEFTESGINFSIIIISLIFLFFMLPFGYQIYKSYSIVQVRNHILSQLLEQVPLTSEISVDTSKGFHFDGRENQTNVAHNITEFSYLLNTIEDRNLRDFLLRKDFSRWIREQLKNDELAEKVKKTENSGSMDELRIEIKRWINSHEISFSMTTSIIDLMKQPVEGITGFNRGMISFGILFVLSIAVVLIFVANNGDPQLANTIMSMMGTTLAAVVGFYFGGKSITVEEGKIG
ncbi:hypothetical protein DSECCO2_12840 [anaerobic digester metagenome]|jgi:hypothetical protein